MYCLSCGAKNNDSANFCQNCGASRDLFRIMPSEYDEVTQVSQSFKQPSSTRPQSSNQNVVLVLAGIAVVIAVGAAGYFYAKSEMRNSPTLANQTANYTLSNNQEAVKPTPNNTVKINNQENIEKQQRENHEALVKQRKVEEANKFVEQAKSEIENLGLQMQEKAKIESMNRYGTYNFNGCTPNPPTIESQTAQKIVFATLFDCRMIGKYFRIKKQQLGINIRSEITKLGDNVSSKLLDSNIVY